MIRIINTDPVHIAKNALIKDCKKCLHLGLQTPPDFNGQHEFCVAGQPMNDGYCKEFMLDKRNDGTSFRNS
jgi:hypothetical protein